MSDPSAFGFGQFVPGFDFLQNLSQNAAKASPAASAIPGMGNWVAPTLSVEEIDKRIQELKAVQFWLEQNGTALKATIQALEVQKMTLTTLQGMNVSMADLAKAFTIKPLDPSAAPEPAWPPKPAPSPSPAAQSEQAAAAPSAGAQPDAAPTAGALPGNSPTAGALPSVDPMAWWGALTQQFQNIAGAAMKDVAAETLKAQAKAKAAAQKTASKVSAKTGAKTSVKSSTKTSTKTNTSAASKASPRRAPAKKKVAAGQTAATLASAKSATRKRPSA